VSFNPEIGSVADVARFHAKNRADTPALIFEDRVTTYRDLDRHASQVANGLRALGIAPQTRVAYLDKNSDQYFEIMLGGAKGRFVTTAVNWRLAPPEIAYILNDCSAEVLFVGAAFFALVDAVAPQLKTVKTIIALQPGRPEWPLYAAWRDAQTPDDPLLAHDPEDVVLQLYTSGTTGHPKGAMLVNRNFIAGRAVQNESGLVFNQWSDSDVSLVAMPCFHIGGSGWGFSGLYVGAKNVVHAEFTPRGVLEAMRAYKISKLFMVPAAMKFVLDDPLCDGTDFSSLKYLLYGASPIPLDLLRRALDVFKCGFVQLYGMTEACGSVTYLPPEDHDVSGNPRMRSAGKPFPGVEIKIIGEDGEELSRGQVGEICVRTVQLMKGYHNLPEASAKAIPADGWLRSGDAGFMDHDGYVFVHDRVKDMIVSGGENIYPAEVESAIFGHPAVADVAVIGVPSERWGEEVKAVVVVKPGASAQASDIIDFARTRIAGYKLPKSVDFIDALPRNATGKILKRELRKPYWEGRERQVN
jgi:acyl-CoA synthetase (AMP-forming)/AMP-acid ligase II